MIVCLFLVVLTAELFSFHILLGADFSWFNWAYYIAVHGAASIIFTCGTWLLLPHRYKFPILHTGLFLFCFSFFIPLFGMIGGIFSLLLGLYRLNITAAVTWVECERSSLVKESDEFRPSRTSTGGLREILTHDLDPSRRLQAVNAVCHLPQQQAIPLLQLALKDLSDDVRLFSYSSLEAIEAKINLSISLLKTQFTHYQAPGIAFNIAQQYWELCYLGLAESVLCAHYLEQASIYLMRSNQLVENAASNLLLGRIMLAQSDQKQALIYLTQAFDAGLLKEQVIPYLAEASFALGNYELTKYYMAQLPAFEKGRLQQQREYWL